MHKKLESLFIGAILVCTGALSGHAEDGITERVRVDSLGSGGYKLGHNMGWSETVPVPPAAQ